ncbi:MAG: MFS transporter [Sandaracinaceae bacterium]|nr:MFS transporter [Sandaracinaceae bacterium]
MASFTGYQWRLFLFLSVATFFEGYDQIALTQILPNLRHDMGLDETAGGALVGVINIGTVVAYVLVRQADRWGRRRVLTITIAGYTIFSFLSGLAPNVWVFAGAQLIARVFLIGEWAISMVYAAEEFPAQKRGLVIGLINAFAAFGSVLCAGVVPLLLRAPWGWRTVYFVGTVPLVLLAFARRSLKETQRFTELDASQKERVPLLRVLRTPHRKRVFQLAAIWGLTYVCTQSAVTFWKEYALALDVTPRLDDDTVGGMIAISAAASMPLVFGVSRLLDWIGRRWTAVLVFTVAGASTAFAYTLQTRTGLLLALIGAIFGVSAVLPVLNAYTTELFPTHLRSDAFAWSNNLLGRLSYVAAPFAVGAAAADVGWGPAVAITGAGPLLALVLIFVLLPETRGRELEETAALEPSA